MAASPEERMVELKACVEAWNAEQRRLFGPPDPAPKTTPAQRAKAKRYYEAHKEQIAERRRDAAYRKTREYQQAMEAIPVDKPLDELTLALREANAKERARLAAEAYRNKNNLLIAAKARQRRAWTKMLS